MSAGSRQRPFSLTDPAMCTYLANLLRERGHLLRVFEYEVQDENANIISPILIVGRNRVVIFDFSLGGRTSSGGRIAVVPAREDEPGRLWCRLAPAGWGQGIQVPITSTFTAEAPRDAQGWTKFVVIALSTKAVEPKYQSYVFGSRYQHMGASGIVRADPQKLFYTERDGKMRDIRTLGNHGLVLLDMEPPSSFTSSPSGPSALPAATTSVLAPLPSPAATGTSGPLAPAAQGPVLGPALQPSMTCPPGMPMPICGVVPVPYPVLLYPTGPIQAVPGPIWVPCASPALWAQTPSITADPGALVSVPSEGEPHTLARGKLPTHMRTRLGQGGADAGTGTD